MNVLGINIWSHDTSACLIADGRLVCAVEEERFIGEKHTTKFPMNAIKAVLGERSLTIDAVNAICIGWDYQRMVRYQYLKPAMESDNELRALPNYFNRLSNFLNTEQVVREQTGFKGAVNFVEHHLAHATLAAYSAGISDALSVVVDGYGDRETLTIFTVKDGVHTRVFGCEFPASVGLVYTAVTDYLGFRRNCDEGIVMGLASYGNPHAQVPGTVLTYIETFRNLVRDHKDTIFEIDPRYFPFGNFRQGFFTKTFESLFGSRRTPGAPIGDEHKNVAAALQLRTEEILEQILVFGERYSDSNSVLLSGGVALNCVANAKLVNGSGKNKRRSILVPPNPGDAGVAIGAALHYCAKKGINVQARSLTHLGPEYLLSQLESAAKGSLGQVTSPEDLHGALVERLAAGKICALFDGGSEFGPRALGHRSILTAPYPASMKDFLNKRVKFREEFRPFAPMVREEEASKYFEIDYPTPYMMHAVPIRPEMQSLIPAVVHVDGTGRVQTVNKNDSPFVHKLLGRFGEKCGVPIILNTSFNVKGQPIVETPEQAVDTFNKTEIDCLVMPPFCIDKQRSDSSKA